MTVWKCGTPRKVSKFTARYGLEIVTVTFSIKTLSLCWCFLYKIHIY